MRRLILLTASLALFACDKASADTKDRRSVEDQQEQYAAAQPVPSFDFSMERQALSDLYQTRNETVATHSVILSERGTLVHDCPSIGYGLPYDTSITNPVRYGYHGAVLDQAEPNGLFASKNTSATWVFCVDETGHSTPVYTESKLSVFPFPVDVDAGGNITRRVGSKSSVNLTLRSK